MKTAEMTSNQFYGRLNARFDRREKEIYALGYRRQSLAGLNLAVYVCEKYMRHNVIQTAAMHHACERAWKDILEDAKRFVRS